MKLPPKDYLIYLKYVRDALKIVCNQRFIVRLYNGLGFMFTPKHYFKFMSQQINNQKRKWRKISRLSDNSDFKAHKSSPKDFCSICGAKYEDRCKHNPSHNFKIKEDGFRKNPS